MSEEKPDGRVSRAHAEGNDETIPRENELEKLKEANAQQAAEIEELKEQVDLPSTLWLKIQNDSALRYCTIKWRKGRNLGIEFSLDKLIQATEEEAKELRRSMRWENMDRRADRDRRSGSSNHSSKERRSSVDRRLDASKPTDVDLSSELADTGGRKI